MAPQTLRFKLLVVAIVCGVLASLATGLVESGPEITIPGYRYYGYPLVWRVTKTLQPTEVRFISLVLDTAFWIAISLLGVIILQMLKLRVGFKNETILLPLGLFIPLGLVMDFVHEFGHATWGTAVGGKLTYMKIAYFEIYPQFAITSEFILGYVSVEGLIGSKYGLFLLAGSLTTNILSWLLAIILLKTSLGHKTQVAMRILGLFGLLDLPFYVLFPQIGLRHWIFFGGDKPEPLLGARNMGIPDSAFYIVVVLTTLGLVFLYFKSLLEKAQETIKIILEKAWKAPSIYQNRNV